MTAPESPTPYLTALLAEHEYVIEVEEDGAKCCCGEFILFPDGWQFERAHRAHVADAITAAGIGPVRAVEGARDAALRERDAWKRTADERSSTALSERLLAAEADVAGLRERVATLANEVDEDWPHADHSGGNGENVLECARCWRDGLLTLATPVRHDDMKGGRG